MRILLAACGIMFAGAAMAETVYDCNITNREDKNVPKQAIVVFDAASGTATAIDGFVNHYVGEPIEAKVVKNNEKRLTVSYSLSDIAASNGNTIVEDETRITIIKASGEAIVSYSQGFGYTATGSGRCTTSN